MKFNKFFKKIEEEITEIENTIKFLQERKEALTNNPSLYIDQKLEDLEDEKEDWEDNYLNIIDELDESLSNIDSSLAELSNALISREKIDKNIAKLKEYKKKLL